MVATDTVARPASADRKSYLFSQTVDFFCLGGGSLPLLLALALLPPDEYKIHVTALALLLTNFINNPHFIHSYQIFYSGYSDKIAERAPLRWRYLWAGIGVPIVAILFYLWCIITLDVQLMAKAASFMLFLVGWHYCKQGYGILIVESVLKRAFFSDFEKTVLRYNALSIWLTTWMFFNRVLVERELYGLNFFTVGVPEWIYKPAIVLCVAMGAFTLAMVLRKAWIGKVPFNGLMAYATSCYVWLILGYFNPITALLIPAFHSLQYLAVVWRYQLNKNERHPPSDGVLFGGIIRTSPARAATAKFILLGTFLGVLLFYAIPFTLDYAIDYREEIFGTTMFLFTIWVFINVHHYFMDNVIWRKDNPDMKENLFG